MSESQKPPLAPAQNAPLRVPDELLLDVRKRIYGLMPHEIAYAASDSVVIDNRSNRLLIDTDDHIPPLPQLFNERERRPAIIRVTRILGGVALDGFIVDHRYISRPVLRPRSDDDHLKPEEAEEWTLYKTDNPLGMLYLLDNETHYIGNDELKATADTLAAFNDIYFQHLSDGYEPSEAYALSLEAISILDS